MSTSPKDPSDAPAPPEKSTAMLMLGDIGDTTWRMFIPTIGLAFAGVYADRQWDTTPWFMLAGAIVGAIIAVFLIKQQLQRVNTK